MSESIENANPLYPSHSTMPAIVIKNVVQLIQQHAISTIWEQSYRCPCVDISTGQPEPNCPVCHGQGWVYLHPKRIDMAIQGDQKRFSLVENGMDELGSSQATPQITVNGIEQGIKPGDRITVEGWTTNDTYTFNVTQQRLNDGIFLPYKVQSINEALIINDGKLEELDVNKNFELKDNFLKIKSEKLLDQTISVSLEIVKRFYVVSMLKELRYEQYYRLADKLWATGNGTGVPLNGDVQKANYKIVQGNDIVQADDPNYPKPANALKQRYPQVVNKDGARIVLGKHQVYRLPPLLLLRRENLYFSNLNVVNSETDNKSVIKDPRANDLDEYLNGD